MCFKAAYLSLMRIVRTGTVFTGAGVLTEQVPCARCHAEGEGKNIHTHTHNPNPSMDHSCSSVVCTTLGMLGWS